MRATDAIQQSMIMATNILRSGFVDALVAARPSSLGSFGVNPIRYWEETWRRHERATEHGADKRWMDHSVARERSVALTGEVPSRSRPRSRTTRSSSIPVPTTPDCKPLRDSCMPVFFRPHMPHHSVLRPNLVSDVHRAPSRPAHWYVTCLGIADAQGPTGDSVPPRPATAAGWARQEQGIFGSYPRSVRRFRVMKVRPYVFFRRHCAPGGELT